MEEKVVKPTVSTNSTQPAPEPAVEAVSKTEQVSQLSDLPNEQKEVPIDSLIPSDNYRTDPLFYEVANYFNIEQEDYDSAKIKLSDIVDYVIRDIKSNQPDQVLMSLRKIEDMLQPPQWGERRYNNVYKYIRLAQKKSTISQAMKAFEK